MIENNFHKHDPLNEIHLLLVYHELGTVPAAQLVSYCLEQPEFRFNFWLLCYHSAS